MLEMRMTGLLVLLFAPWNVQARAIYGVDDRSDPWDWLAQGQLATVAQAARATAVHIVEENLAFDPARGDYSVLAKTLEQRTRGQGLSLCPGERFGNQLTAGNCSATLIAPNRILTAGHCISGNSIPGPTPMTEPSEESCRRARYVFGYEAMSKTDSGPKRVAVDQVYNCKSVVKYSYDGTAMTSSIPDFAIVELDREVRVASQPNLLPVEIDPRTEIPVGTKIALISYPSGLPIKIAPGVTVPSTVPGSIQMETDAYVGSSGGAVLALDTQKIIGIMVSGNGGGYYFRSDARFEEGGCLGSKFYDPSQAAEHATPATGF